MIHESVKSDGKINLKKNIDLAVFNHNHKLIIKANGLSKNK